ncbi:MAG: malate synthase A [Legionellaceae bacterium]|nr:malate synthase A [Legionellaceae bacterium]
MMHQPQEHTILNPACRTLLDHLHRRFEEERQQLLAMRRERQESINQGIFPDFIEATQSIRQADWRAADIPEEIQDRRVEITGPVERKMIINALNSAAKVFMADFEDSNAPSWENCIQGQVNLYDAVRGKIEYDDSVSGKQYRLKEKTAVLMVRPRGWHLDEVHYQVDGTAISAAIFDFAVYLFHNAQTLIEQGSAPYYYIPKLESYQEAVLWETIIAEAERCLELPAHCVKVTLLIETITAVFEMDEMIYALKERIVGLNCGRWDYIFSYIKKFHRHAEFVLPERQQVSMNTPFLQAYVSLLIYTCHRRGIHAMGGMAAQIPIKNDEQANQQAMDAVRADKLREVRAGHDGTWVAHPGLITLALDVFNEHMPEKNQIAHVPEKPTLVAKDLLEAPAGSISIQGVMNNITVALHYLRSWLAGSGCVPVNHLMEDAATAEICRAQLWQWRHFESQLTDGTVVDRALLEKEIEAAFGTIAQTLDKETEKHYLQQAKRLLEDLIFSQDFAEFLTSRAYPQLNKNRS